MIASVTLNPAGDPTGRYALLQRANTLRESRRFAELDALCRTWLYESPDDAQGHVARAQVLRALNRLDEALDECDRSIEIQDDYARAWFVKCLVLLAQGRYAEGWPLYEWRGLTPEFLPRQPTFPQPLWDGSPLSGRTLLVH